MTDDTPIRLGLLRLTDAAPVIFAQERGLFRALGVAVELSVEPSWANIADKLSYGLLDGAVMLPPLALAITLGSRGPAAPLIVPMGLSLGGNSVTFSTALAAPLLRNGRRPAPIEAARRLAHHLANHADAEKPRLAVVHTLSTHNLLLRYWLAAAGISPDEAFDLSVIPPAEMVDALEAGRISGFCAGAPWGAVAARAGLGRMVTGSSGIWANHPEKCLAVSRAWAERQPAKLLAVQRALLRAAQSCDKIEETPAIARMLARDDYVGVTPAAIRSSLPGAKRHRDSDLSIFFRYTATYPWRSHAIWFLTQMKRWGYIDDHIDMVGLATRVYRPDLYAAAARLEAVPVPDENSLPGDTRFCDGAPLSLISKP